MADSSLEKVLIIDDEDGIRKVLRIILSEAGYAVICAVNGEEGLTLFERERPSVIVTDIRMPGLDGIGVLKAVKERTDEAEVVVITGHGEMELAIQALKLQASDFINKPISNDAILLAVERALDRVAVRRRLKQYTGDLERQVEEATRRLIQNERMAAMGETVAGMAHAVKNILGGLTGGAFVVDKGLELGRDDLVRQGWDMVQRNVSRIRELVMDLLTYAKDREPELETCDPNEIISEVVELMSPVAGQYGVDLVMEPGLGVSPWPLDRKWIQRCLANLISNAIDACSEPFGLKRPGRVTVGCQELPGGRLCLQVSDNGCGMDEEIRGKIFTSFFSTKGSRGTGLGLMLTQKMVHEHGGTVEVESQVGSGSTFRVILPRQSQDWISGVSGHRRYSQGPGGIAGSEGIKGLEGLAC